MYRAFLVTLFVGLFSTSVLHAGNRADNTFGIFLSIDNPYPSVVSFNAGYNFGDLARLTAGYGSISATTTDGVNTGKLTATTIGGTLGFFLPGWNLSPTAGLGYANIDVTATGTVSTTTDVGGFRASDSHTYGFAGLDWTSSGGFHFAGGMNFSFKEGVSSLIYLNLGWFF